MILWRPIARKLSISISYQHGHIDLKLTMSQGQPQEDAYQFGQPTGANQLSGLAQQTGIQSSSRLGLTSPAGDQGERTTTSTIGDDRHGGDRSSNARSRTVANPFQNQQDQGPIGYTGRAPGTSDQAPTEPASSPQATNPSKQKRLSEMTEQERWGMPGLLAKINAESPDYDILAVGMNIGELGMNLESTE